MTKFINATQRATCALLAATASLMLLSAAAGGLSSLSDGRSLEGHFAHHRNAPDANARMALWSGQQRVTPKSKASIEGGGLRAATAVAAPLRSAGHPG